MTITVQMFAGAREAAGRDELRVDVPPGATYADLLQAIISECPALGPLAEASRLAVDAAYADPTAAVEPDAQIALIPPVSGG